MSAALALLGRAFGWFAGSPLGRLVLEFFWAKAVAFIVGVVKRMKRKKEIRNEVEKSVEPLKKAETAEEIDAAIDQSLDGF